MSIIYSSCERPVIEDNVRKAIKFKLNNEAAWKKQNLTLIDG